VSWVELFAVLVVCHMVGDYVLQTNWQAVNKHGGLGPDRVSQRALGSHVATYMLAFVPALIWIANERGALAALVSAAAIALTHFVQDDGRLLERYERSVKQLDPAEQPLPALLADQAFHAVALLVVALIVAT
jgi:Protein of unknown function (DUF3307)